MLTLLAPAKINLTLEVLARRPDGFHEIRSVAQTINLCDSLYLKLGNNIRLSCDAPGFIPSESLIFKAAKLVAEATGGGEGVEIELEKRIPLSAGLGGDSSGAAAILEGLNELWQLGLSRERLMELAAELGSDVGLFLCGGTALVGGRGERVTPLSPLPQRWVVLVMPAVPKIPEKTKQLYSSLKDSHFTDGKITERMAKALKSGKGFEPSMLFNTFENVAFERFSELEVYKEHFIKLGAPHVHLAGSGPALFSLMEDRTQAAELCRRFLQQGLESYLVDTLGGAI